MQVKIKKDSEGIITPAYSKIGDAGLDFTATKILSENDYQITYDTGISLEIPEDYVGLVFPRSSIRNYDLQLSNSVGVIDSGYRGVVQATFNKTNGSISKTYNVGDRIFQMIIIPYPSIELVVSNELSNSERGIGGFGSTNK